jgi:hypothetical protein
VLMFVVMRININNLDFFNTKWQHQKLIDIFLNCVFLATWWLHRKLERGNEHGTT